MTRFELRWAKAILRAFTPAEAPDMTAPRYEIRYLDTLQRMCRDASPKAALGLRAAIWLVAWAPLWFWGRLATVSGLPDQRRTDLLMQLLCHRSFLIRESCSLLKLAASFALFRSRAFRALTGYDAAAARAQEHSELRRRLPLLMPAVGAGATGRLVAVSALDTEEVA